MEPWSIFVFELASVVLTLLWMIKAVADRKLSLVIPQTIWPLGALVLLGLAQSVSWNDGAGFRQSLSLDVESTRGTALVLCSLLALSILAANFLNSAVRLLTLTQFLIFFGAVMGVFGLVQYFSGEPRCLLDAPRRSLPVRPILQPGPLCRLHGIAHRPPGRAHCDGLRPRRKEDGVRDSRNVYGRGGDFHALARRDDKHIRRDDFHRGDEFDAIAR